MSAAYASKSYAAMAEHAREAVAAVPCSVRAQYNLACAQALSGDSAAALATLEGLVRERVYFDVAADEDLASMRGTPGFEAVRAAFERLRAPIEKSTVAFTLAETDFVPEGMAHDPRTGAFFVGSVHRRMIVRLPTRGGAAALFASEREQGLDAVLGMAADAARRSLWVCTTALAEMRGFVPADAGRATLVELDLDNGRVRRKLPLGGAGEQRNCNDLTVDSSGTVYVADSRTGAILRLTAGASALEPFILPGFFLSPGGIALTPDERALYVADYGQGLFRIERCAREITLVSAPADASLLGIDGLRAYGSDLIAVQNGIQPHRVVRLSLSPDGRAVRAATMLEAAHSRYDEPTLGVVVDRAFYYVANSHWGRFDAMGRLPAAAELTPPTILRLPLVD